MPHDKNCKAIKPMDLVMGTQSGHTNVQVIGQVLSIGTHSDPCALNVLPLLFVHQNLDGGWQIVHQAGPCSAPWQFAAHSVEILAAVPLAKLKLTEPTLPGLGGEVPGPAPVMIAGPGPEAIVPAPPPPPAPAPEPDADPATD